VPTDAHSNACFFIHAASSWQNERPLALVKPGETRFGTHYTCMKSLLYAKRALKRLFMHIEANPDDIPAQSRSAAEGIGVSGTECTFGTVRRYLVEC
jgi:hypothetical protein